MFISGYKKENNLCYSQYLELIKGTHPLLKTLL